MAPNCTFCFVFACKVVPNRVPPHIKYHCDLGAVYVSFRWPQGVLVSWFRLQNRTKPLQIPLRLRCRLGAVRCRSGAGKMHMLLSFPCNIVRTHVPPHIKYHCDLGAVYVPFRCRFGGRKLYRLFNFPCQIVPTSVSPLATF